MAEKVVSSQSEPDTSTLIKISLRSNLFC